MYRSASPTFFPRHRLGRSADFADAFSANASGFRLAHALRPDPALAGRQDPIRIERILDRLVEAPQRVIIERVFARNEVHERGVRAIFAPAVLRRHLRQLFKHFARPLILLHVVLDRKAE